MKKAIAIILTFIMMLGCISVSAYTIDLDFEDNLISLHKRALWYEVTLEKFAQYGVVNIEQTGTMSYILTLDKHDHQNVLDVISQINSSEDSYVLVASKIPYQTPTDPEKDYLYKEKFIEYEVDINNMGTLHWYDERFYHTDVDGNIDWALLYAYTGPSADCGARLKIGERIIQVNDLCSPFTYKYGIYDVKEDKFVAIDEYIDYSKYDGLKEYVYTNVGVLIGDADKDDELTVLDATMIQRCVAKTCTYKEKYWIDDHCDMDEDYRITVIDATVVQTKIAKMN